MGRASRFRVDGRVRLALEFGSSLSIANAACPVATEQFHARLAQQRQKINPE